MVGFSPVSFGVYLTFRPLALRQSRLYMCCNGFFFFRMPAEFVVDEFGIKVFLHQFVGVVNFGLNSSATSL